MTTQQNMCLENTANKRFPTTCYPITFHVWSDDHVLSLKVFKIVSPTKSNITDCQDKIYRNSDKWSLVFMLFDKVRCYL